MQHPQEKKNSRSASAWETRLGIPLKVRAEDSGSQNMNSCRLRCTVLQVLSCLQGKYVCNLTKKSKKIKLHENFGAQSNLGPLKLVNRNVQVI